MCDSLDLLLTLELVIARPKLGIEMMQELPRLSVCEDRVKTT
jgi:hypothetical protein